MSLTTTKQDQETDSLETTTIYSGEDFTEYDERIHSIKIRKPMTPSGQISDFLRFIDNCKNIKSLLEEYNDHAVRVTADNIRAAALEKEWAVMIKIQQEKIIQVQQAARLVRVELILVNRTIIINKAQLEKVNKEEAGQYIKKAMGKKQYYNRKW